MLTHYLRLAVRSLVQQKGYSAINIAGLGVGLAACLLLLLHIQSELQFDRFHEHADEIYRVEQVDLVRDEVGAVTAYPLAPTLATAFSEVTETVRLGQDLVQITIGETTYQEEQFYWTDASVFDVFSFPLLQGDPRTALAVPNGIVLTASTAARYFGEADPVGQVVAVKVYDGDRVVPMEVTGVAADVPDDSHLQFDILGSMATGMAIYPQFEEMWGLHWVHTYARVAPGTSLDGLAARVPDVIEETLGERARETDGWHFEPITRIHLYSRAGSDRPGSIAVVYLFGSVAGLILLLACINFVNLTTARTSQRSNEIGVRKALGAQRGQLARQFLGEAMVAVGLSLGLAGGLVAAALPAFNAVTAKDLRLSALGTPMMILAVLGLTVVVGVLAGGYPAFLLSRFQPARALRGKGAGDWAAFVRKGLVVVQFALAITLLVGATGLHRQMDYVQTTDLGFDRGQLVTIPVTDREVQGEMREIQAEMRRQPGVMQVATSSEDLPSAMNNRWRVRGQGMAEEDGLAMDVVGIDPGYFPTLGTEFVEGRNLSDRFPSDATSAVILNEAAVRSLGWETATGRSLEVEGRSSTVVGVVEDIHSSSLRQRVEPVVYLIVPGTTRASPDTFILRVAGDDMEGTLAALRETLDRFSPAQPFAYHFVDQSYAALYEADVRNARLFDAFTLLAIVIACLGLFGLAAFATEQRRKEVGIRKVLGASVAGLVALLSADFLTLVLVAFGVAVPLAAWGMGRWLEAFAYHAEMGPGLFLSAGLAAIAIALATVGSLALRAATADPIRALRSE